LTVLRHNHVAAACQCSIYTYDWQKSQFKHLSIVKLVIIIIIK